MKDAQIFGMSDSGNLIPTRLDSDGGQIMYPYQIRNMICTAQVVLTNGTETTLLAGTAEEFHDLLTITGFSDSTTVALDLRSRTGGSVVHSFRHITNNSYTLNLSAPIPQDEAGDTWTVDLPDVTGLNYTVSAVFVKRKA